VSTSLTIKELENKKKARATELKEKYYWAEYELREKDQENHKGRYTDEDGVEYYARLF
jgi:hypothetical protein